MLVLRVLATAPLHGYGIAQRLKLVSSDVLAVGESSLYPALQRLLLNGDVEAEWALSDRNRRARYYTLTRAGRKRLATEQSPTTGCTPPSERCSRTPEAICNVYFDDW